MSENEHSPVLSSVVVLRVNEFARRPVAEQARLRAQLETVLAVLLPDMPAHQRIVLEGDGTAGVAVLDNPQAALALAERALRSNQIGLGLSIGIDHGPVELVSGEDDAQVVAVSGDGLATAALTASFAQAQSLLVSPAFRWALAQAAPGAESVLVPAGSFNDAGLRSYPVYAVDALAPQRRRRRFLYFTAAAVLLLAAVAAGVRLGVPQRPRPLAPYLEGVRALVLDVMPRNLHGQP
ncbi:MAG: hypothetical protein OEY75_04925 [Hylemonella sp.]|nr:hypothetical protein [Hylemonella sp.]MDH5708436.1 hypothetical protein [Hylemonella sp.]